MYKVKFILLLIIATLVFAQDYSGYAGSYLHNGSDARTIAMGNALTAGSDINYPAFFNPAGVASVTYRKLLFTHQFLSFDRSQSIISFTAPLPPIGGISVGWIGVRINDIDGRDISGIHTSDLSATEDAFLISFGIAPVPKFQFGGTVKILQNKLPNISGNIIGTGVGFDFGVLYKIFLDLDIALVIKDINSAYQWSNESTEDLGRIYKDKFPLQIRTGAQYKIKSICILSDIGFYFSEKKYLDVDYKIGAEFTYSGKYFFRSGYRNNRFAIGVGLTLDQFDKFTSLIDYAFVVEPIANATHVISYAVNF